MKIALVLLLAVSVVNGFAQSAPSGQAADLDAMHYFKEGSILFREQKYSGAIGPYQKALDLEKQKHILSQDFFRVLVDNLGMAYGISGNIPEARATFEYD